MKNIKCSVLGPKEAFRECKKSSYNLIKGIGLVFYHLGILIYDTGILIVECFNWVARKRCKAPVFSLFVELIVFSAVVFSVYIVYYTRAKETENQLGIQKYQLEQLYKDSLINAEINGYDMAKQELKKQ